MVDLQIVKNTDEEFNDNSQGQAEPEHFCWSRSFPCLSLVERVEQQQASDQEGGYCEQVGGGIEQSSGRLVREITQTA